MAAPCMHYYSAVAPMFPIAALFSDSRIMDLHMDDADQQKNQNNQGNGEDTVIRPEIIQPGQDHGKRASGYGLI